MNKPFWHKIVSSILLVTFLNSLFTPVFAATFAADDQANGSGTTTKIKTKAGKLNQLPFVTITQEQVSTIP
jgi:hypothetical protein